MKGCAIVFVSILCLQVPLLVAEEGNLHQYREVRYVMGTYLDITLYHHDAKRARQSLDEAFALAQGLDNLLSNYNPRSEINWLNQKAGRGRVRVSPQLYQFLALVKSLAQKTEGAFDPTVGPLMGLWNEAEKKGNPPSLASLKAALNLVGMQHVVLYENSEVNLSLQGMAIDTGGIGKGYAVDEIVALLKRLEITRSLINFGQSSIYAIGSPPQLHAWKLLLKFPGQNPLGILELKDQALSASDTFGRPFEIAGQRYGHLMDPKSGLPTSPRIQAVALGPSAAEAEALSKYVILRGWRKQNVERWGEVQILRIDQTGEIQRSDHFPLKWPAALDH